MGTDAAKESSLRIVGKEGPKEPLKIFCGHCGRSPEPGSDVPASRVCSRPRIESRRSVGFPSGFQVSMASTGRSSIRSEDASRSRV